MINSDFNYTKKQFYQFAAYGKAFVFNAKDDYIHENDDRVHGFIVRIQRTLEEYFSALSRLEQEKWTKQHTKGITTLALMAFGRYTYINMLKHLRKTYKSSFLELFLKSIPLAIESLFDPGIVATYGKNAIEDTKLYIENHLDRLLLLIEREILREQLSHVTQDGNLILVIDTFHVEYFYKLPKAIKGFVIRHTHDKNEVAEFSHVYEIPMIETDEKIINDDRIIIDNIDNKFYINPTNDIYDAYIEKIDNLIFSPNDNAKYQMTERKYYATIVDRRYLNLVSNKSFYAGLGMYRPEYFFMAKGMLPREEELTEIYCDIVDHFIDREVYFLLPDLGEYKMLDYAPNITTYIKECLKNQGLFFWVFYEAVKRTAVIKNKRFHLVVPMLRSKDEVELWKERINFIFSDLPEELRPLIGMHLETESAVDYAEDYVRTDFSFIGLDTLCEEINDDYSRYDDIPIQFMKKEIHHLIQFSHQHLRRTGIRKKHLISGHMMRNKAIFHKLFTMGFKDFIIPVTRMKSAEEKLHLYESTRGRYIGVAQQRRKNKALKKDDTDDDEERQK